MDSSQNGALHGEIVDVDADAPREGSLAWLELHEHVWTGAEDDPNRRELPSCHRFPVDGSYRSDTERGSRCAVVRADGTACGAVGTRRYGVCIAHAGGGASDLAALSRKGTAKLARLRVQREVLGIGANTAGAMANPRVVARLAAAERAGDIAAALLAPLDSRKLGPMDRQTAARVILGETFPLASLTLDVDVPSDPGELAGMGWQDLQALAARLLEP